MISKKSVKANAVTRLALRNRFTFAEKVAIETAAETDAEVRVLLKDLESATHIDLTRPDTIAGMQILESKGILAAGRSAEIMDANTITEQERPEQ